MSASTCQSKVVLSVIVSLWFVFLGLYVFIKQIVGQSSFAMSVPFIGQDVFDFASIAISFFIFTRVDERLKPIFMLFTLAFVFLASTDILFHFVFQHELAMPRVLRPGYLGDYVVDVPFLCFVGLFSWAAIRFYRLEVAADQQFSSIVNAVVIFAGMFGFCVFVCVLLWGDASPTYIHGYFVLQAGVGLVGFVIALLIMSRVQTQLVMTFTGFLMLVVVDYSINLHTAINFGVDSDASVPQNNEMAWLLAVMLMFGGLLQYLLANQLHRKSS